MAQQEASVAAENSVNSASNNHSILKKDIGPILGKILGGLFILFIVGRCTMIKIDEWNMSPTERAAYQAKIQARWAAEEAEKNSKASSVTKQATPATRLAEYRAFVDHMSAHQSSQCRRLVSGDTATLLRLTTEVSESSELLYKSTLKWARDGACV